MRVVLLVLSSCPRCESGWGRTNSLQSTSTKTWLRQLRTQVGFYLRVCFFVVGCLCCLFCFFSVGMSTQRNEKKQKNKKTKKTEKTEKNEKNEKKNKKNENEKNEKKR